VNIPKASLSRITTNLEKKGLIRKERVGISTTLILVEKH